MAGTANKPTGGACDVLVTTFSVFGKRALLTIASWCECPPKASTKFNLSIDWDALGLSNATTKVTAPSVGQLQNFSQMELAQLELPIVLKPGSGLVVELRAAATQHPAMQDPRGQAPAPVPMS
jgi:hypothetical protein